jgi:hypothetical protein
MTLTADQIKDIADDLEALGDELSSRNWAPDLSASVMASAAGNLVSIAAMRAPVPQQAFCPLPTYPYQDLLPGGQSATLQLTVTGRTRAELEESARQQGEGFFGTGNGLMVTLTTPAVMNPAGATPGYTCGAVVRQRESQGLPGQTRGPGTPLG